MDAALAPVVGSLRDAARRRADGIRSRARAESDDLLAQAHRQAAQLVADARQRGADAASLVVAAETAAARRRAREEVLAARRGVYEALRRTAVDALVQLASTEEGACLAGLDPATLCDEVLATMAQEVERLWA